MRRPPVSIWVSRLGSLRLTPIGIVLLAIGVLASYRRPEASVFWVVAPLLLLSLNLLAAIAANPRFRRQPWLLVFHLCLLLVILLAGLGVLTRMQGRVEIAEGQSFRPEALAVSKRGPWHPGHLEQLRFEQGRIEVDYAPGLRRRQTRTEVWLETGAGRVPIRFGDGRSFEWEGYRFATTSNKGYAALLSWQDRDVSQALLGAVHFPSFPLFSWKQENRWTTPAGQALRLELELPDKVPEDRSWTLSRGETDAYALHVEAEGRRVTLAVGESLGLEGGVLRFEGVRLWIGYRVDYDPVLPWIFVTALVGTLALGAHFWERLRVLDRSAAPAPWSLDDGAPSRG